MTFLCTKKGRLVPGDREHSGTWPWPQPWAFRCDSCGRTLPYRSVLRPLERRLRIDDARNLSGDVHRCGWCEGWTEQLELFPA